MYASKCHILLYVTVARFGSLEYSGAIPFFAYFNHSDRIVGRQSMPLATGLPADGFRLSYMDNAGAVLDPDARGLDATERAAIGRVRVALLSRAASGESLASVMTEVALRNHPWTPQP